jgi:hypothetical protein
VEAFAGPKFREKLSDRVNQTITPEYLVSKALESDILPLGTDMNWAQRKIEPHMARVRDYVATSLRLGLADHLEKLNAITGRLLVDGATAAGLSVLCLTEDPHNPVMWSHYARDYAGFVLALDAFHPWFWFDKEFERPRIFKVQYDERLATEFLDLIDAGTIPFLRKRQAWSFENEWRMLDSTENRTKHIEANDISLFEIPADAILGILIGYRMPADASMRIIKNQVVSAPHVQLRMVRPNYSTGFLESVPIGDM